MLFLLKLYYLVISILFIYSQTASLEQEQLHHDNDNDLQIIMAVYITRHGARAPKLNYYELNKDYWMQRNVIPYGLTDVGARQHHSLGLAFRKRYIEKLRLLSPIYHPNEIKIYSSSKDRTIASAQAHLLGLYPFEKGPDFYNNTDIIDIPPWISSESEENDNTNDIPKLPNGIQLIPIIAVNDTQDILFHSYSQDICPNQKIFIDEQISSELYNNIQNNMNSTFETVSNLMNQTRKEVDIKSIKGLVSSIYCEIYDGKKNIINLESDLGKNLTFLQNFYVMYALAGTYKQKQLGAHPFLTKLNKIFGEAINNSYEFSDENRLKLVFFSGHDYNLVYLLNALNITSWQCILEYYKQGKELGQSCFGNPKFASSINFELYKRVKTNNTSNYNYTNDTYFIKVLYNGQEMNICDTGYLCPYSEFLKLLSKIILSERDFANLCGNKLILSKYEAQSKVIINHNNDDWVLRNFLEIILLCLIILLSINLYYIWKKTESIRQTPLYQDKLDHHTDVIYL